METIQRIFDLDPQLLHDALILAINIFILFLAGSYFLFNPVRDMLKKRQDMIEADIENAKKDKEEAALLKSEYDDKLKNVDKEADKILADARKKAMLREEPKLLNSNLLPVKANGDVRLRSVVSFLKSGRTSTPIPILTL